MMFGGGMILAWLLPIILLFVGGAWLLNNSSSTRNSGGGDFEGRSEKTPYEIAQERYARGEITREEYEEVRTTLQR